MLTDSKLPLGLSYVKQDYRLAYAFRCYKHDSDPICIFFFLMPLHYLQWNYYSVSTVYKEGDSGLTFNLSFFTWRHMHVCMY